MNTERILLGLAAAVACDLVAGELLSGASSAVHPVLQSVALSFLATAIGALIARRRFVLPALGLLFVECLLVVYILFAMAAPTGQARVLAIAGTNLLSLVLSALSVVMGALVGQALARRAQRGALAI